MRAERARVGRRQQHIPAGTLWLWRGRQRAAFPIRQTLHAQTPQYAAEISVAELHAAILDGAAVCSGQGVEAGPRQPQAARDRVVPTPPHLCRPCAKRVVRAAEGRRSAARGRLESTFSLQVLPRVHAMM